MHEQIPEEAEDSAQEVLAALSESEHANLRLYLLAIGREPLLNAEEEIMLGHLIQDGRAARQLMTNDNPTEQEKAELEAVADLGDQAWERMVKSNLRLVVSIAKKFQSSQMPLLDIVQEANIALFRAAENFEPDAGVKFSTYASGWIYKQAKRSSIEGSQMIHIPEYAYYDAIDVWKLEAELHSEKGVWPSSEEIADKLKLSLDHVVALRFIKEPISLEALIEEQPSREGAIEKVNELDSLPIKPISVDAETLNATLPELTFQQREIFYMLIGEGEYQQMTLDEIAEYLNIKRESVDRTIVRVLKKAGIPSPFSRKRKTER